MNEDSVAAASSALVVQFLEANGLFVARLPELEVSTHLPRVDLLALRLRSSRIDGPIRNDPGLRCDPERNELLLVSVGRNPTPTTNIVCLVQPSLTEAMMRLVNISDRECRSLAARVLRHGRGETTTGLLVRHLVFAASLRDLTENAHWVPLEFVRTFLSASAGAAVPEAL